MGFVGENHFGDTRSALIRHAAKAMGLPSRWIAGTVAFGFAVVFLIAATVFSSINVARLRGATAWVQHTDAVLLQAAAVREALLEAGAALRGFVLTADPRFIGAHDQARSALKRRVGGLARLVADNPAQMRRLGRLNALINAREALLDRGGGLKLSRLGELTTALREQRATSAFLEFGSAIKTDFDTFRGAELSLLKERERSMEAGETLLLVFAAVMTALTLASSIIGTVLIQRERGIHRAREVFIEVMHNQRLGLMGETAAALAHEINQPLTASANYLGALRRLLSHDGAQALSRAQDLAQKASEQTARAGAIIKRLRAFIEKRDAIRAPESPQTLVSDAVGLFGTLDKAVHLATAVEDDLPDVLVDRIQVQQVLVNLMRNAIEAMCGGPRQDLVLRARRAGAREVEFSLADSGPGLTPKIAERLFKPFVTSKKEGLGVGLAICHGIVAGHGGRIWAEAAPGGGALFRFTLPVAQKAAAKSGIAPELAAPGDADQCDQGSLRSARKLSE